MIKTIIFDFDGTLADTQQTIFETAQATLQSLGLKTIAQDDIRKLIGLPLHETFVRLVGRSDTPDLFEQCVDTYHRLFEEKADKSIHLFPHVKETLEKLHKEGITQAIASSRGHASLSSLTKRLGLSQFLTTILGEDDVEKKKPEPDMVIEILQRTNTNREEALVVGDTTFDIAMGQGAGCRTVGVSYGNHSRQQISSHKPTFIIDDMIELIDIVHSANNKL